MRHRHVRSVTDVARLLIDIRNLLKTNRELEEQSPRERLPSGLATLQEVCWGPTIDEAVVVLEANLGVPSGSLTGVISARKKNRHPPVKEGGDYESSADFNRVEGKTPRWFREKHSP